MIAAFTICSNNYLAHALTWARSLQQHAPDWMVFIGLVDVQRHIDGIRLDPGIGVLPLAAIGVSQAEDMARRYNIVELCTAVKASYFRHIFSTHPDVDQIHYFDPDILFLGSPSSLSHALRDSAIALISHHLTPMPLDGGWPDEPLSLNHGIFNLGYLGLRRCSVASELLVWWEDRMRHHCRIDLREGLFVDQLWFNLVPIYFPGVHVIRDPGANVAYWNLHERQITKNHQVIFCGQRHPLTFFHFSGFSPESPGQLTRRPLRCGPQQQPELLPLMRYYADQLVSNGYSSVAPIESTYTSLRREHVEAAIRRYRIQHPRKYLIRKLKDLIPERVKRLLRA